MPDLVSIEDKTGGKAKTDGQIAHDLACKVLAGDAELGDVPADWQAGVTMYVDFARENNGDFIFEHFWESICIDDFGGTTDTVILNGRKCAILDFKTGKWPVDAKNNTQLMCYAAIIAEHHDVDEFYGAIIQPKPIRGPKVKVDGYTLEQIDEHREKVAVAAVSDEKGVGDHCRFCPIRLMNKCDEGRTHARKKGWK